MADAKPRESAAQLNFYTARMASPGAGSTLLGYSYNPWDVVDFPTYDGVYVNDRTMPGGSAVSSSYTFNLGIVSIHEVGTRALALGATCMTSNPRDAGLPRRQGTCRSCSTAILQSSVRRFCRLSPPGDRRVYRLCLAAPLSGSLLD